MTLDCRGEACPIPVIKTKKALDALSEGACVTVYVDIVEAVENIAKMVASRGYLQTVEEKNGDYIITITKVADSQHNAAGDMCQIPAKQPVKAHGTVVVIASDRMGEGDDMLGRTLLKTFITTLADAEPLPKIIIFYNGGVRFTTEGSPLLEDLHGLAREGVDIISCGACLQYYGLTEKLLAGRVSNMYEIVNLMMNHSVVKP